MSLIHFEFIIVHGIREYFNFILLHALSSFPSTTYWSEMNASFSNLDSFHNKKTPSFPSAFP